MQLGMHGFGEVYATSISSGVVMKTQFFQGKSFQLGPVKITNPVFMAINIEKLLQEVDGLCGFDYGVLICSMAVSSRCLQNIAHFQYMIPWNINQWQ